jgi:TonB-linked SusC/RagA family outer membrane protein
MLFKALPISPPAGFTKILRVMKLSAMIMLAACLHVSASGLSQTISLSEKNAPLERVFKEIHNQTGLEFVYNTQMLAAANKVDIDVKAATVEQVLDICFKGQPFTYTVVDKVIIVKQKDAAKDESSPPTLVKIRGEVYNEAGQPLAGANVTIKEMGKGVVTNARGEFDLGAIPVNSTIIISFIGYAPQKITVKVAADLKIYMKVTNNELDKVVIQAYGTTTQRLQTGDISTVSAEEIERQPGIMNPLLALEGKVSGLDVTQLSGYASGPVKVELRGRGSLGDFPSDPLYIVDGVPLTVNEVGGESSYSGSSTGFLQNGYMVGPAGGQSPLFSINTDDVESITVLKDADATAIYGSRGANGVILVTTKRGKAGKTRFDMKAEEGYSRVTRFWKLLSTPQYLAVRREAMHNDGITPDAGSAYDLLTWDTTRNIDWQRATVGGTGKVLNVQGGLSGGDAYTTFRVGVGYKRMEQPTTVSGADQSGSFSLNLEHKSLDQRFTVSSTTQYNVTKSNSIGLPGIVNMAPDAPPIYDSAGNLNYAGWAPVSTKYPFAGLKQPYTSEGNFLNSNLVVGFQPVRGLVLKSSFGYNFYTGSQTKFAPISSLNPARNPTGTSNFGYNTNKNWIVEPQTAYDGFISKGKVSAVLGGSLQENSTDGQYIEGTGYTDDALLRTISNAPNKFASDAFGEYKYAAIFGRVNYNWEDKYLLNLSARRDGSSKFGANHEYGNFWAVGAAWIFTEESWFKNHAPLLTFGKLRGSYGTTGSDYVVPYSYLTRWSSSNFAIPYGSVQPLVPTQHANPDYEWQVDKKLEFALEVGFLTNSRLSFSAIAYRNRCGNQLVSFPLPVFTGFGTVQANLPALVQNEGLEFTLSGKIIDTKNLVWSVNGNFSVNSNKLVAYPNLAQSPYASTYQIGKPLNLVYLLHATGVDPQTGQYTFQDRNHDGVININPGPTDDRFIHNLSPRFFGGFGSDFTYKLFQISVFFVYKDQIGVNAINQGQAPGTLINQPIQILGKEWTKPGDRVSDARFTTQPQRSDGYFSSTSDGGYTDASFIRLRNVALSYGLSPSYIKKVGLQNCTLFVRAENLFVFTKYMGIDPETQNFGQLPPPKTITLGLKFTF